MSSRLVVSLGALACAMFLPSTSSAQSLSSVTPATGPTAGGTALTLTGTGFGTQPGAVTVGAFACANATWTAAQVICRTDPGEGVDHPVTLRTAGGATATWAAGTFRYEAPVLSSITPPSAPAAGGTALTLSGNNFGLGPNTTVTVGGAACPITQRSHTSITCTAPPGSGDVTVQVRVAGQDSNTRPFSYTGPAITSVDPASGPTAGNIPITIRGVNFGAQPSATVGGSACPVSMATAASVVCTLPAGVGADHDVSVRTSTGETANARAAFDYQAPAVTLVTAQSRPTAGGVPITITGSNFGASGVTATVGLRTCAVGPTGFQSHGMLVCTLPEGAGAAQPVVVRVGGQQNDVPGRLSYDPPSITAVSPALGSTRGGTLITLSGANFGPTGSNVSVVVDGTPCTDAVAVSHGRMTCGVPAGQGTAAILAVVEGQVSSPFSSAYDAPAITSVAGMLPTRGGTTLTITGDSFGTRDGGVLVGTAACPVSMQDHGAITCTLPPGQGADIPLQVSVGTVQSSTFAVSYDPPSILSVEPSRSPTVGGGTLTITGENFGTTGSVRVGDAACPTQSHDHARITCTIPPGVGSSAPVSVSVSGRTAPAAAFGYAAPSVLAVTPQSAPARGGVTITLTGSNFGAAGASVTVGGNACPVERQGHMQVVCTLPAGRTGPAAVVVQQADQQGSSALFAYTGPSIRAVVPELLPEEGGVLAVEGEGFAAGAVVNVGGTACTVLEARADVATCVVGAGTGTQLVEVCVDGSCSGTVPLRRYPTCGGALQEGEPCEDGNTCTGAGTCVSGSCVGATADREGLACRAPSACSAEGTCSAGTCQAAALNDGLACSDDGAACSAGACTVPVPDAGMGGASSSSSGQVASSSSSGPSSSEQASSTGGASSTSTMVEGSSSAVAGASSGASSVDVASSGAEASSAASGGSGAASRASSTSTMRPPGSSRAESSSSAGTGSASSTTSNADAGNNNGDDGDGNGGNGPCMCAVPGSNGMPAATWFLLGALVFVRRRVWRP